MTFYYAMGGGLGHLTRARVFLQNTGITNFKVLSGHPAANSIFTQDQLIIVHSEISGRHEIYQEWFSNLLNTLSISHFILDTFPNGILGEINPGILNPDWHVTYITRRMKWHAYAEKADPFPVDQVILLEQPEKVHFEYLQQICQNFKEKSLDYSTMPALKPDLHDLKNISDPVWLIIHSEPREEVEELLAFAIQKAELMNITPFYLVITNCAIDLTENGKVIKYFPGWAYYTIAGAIFTGCGFNSMHIPVPNGVPHFFLPFPRRYDDQFWRARESRKSKVIS